MNKRSVIAAMSKAIHVKHNTRASPKIARLVAIVSNTFPIGNVFFSFFKEHLQRHTHTNNFDDWDRQRSFHPPTGPRP